MSQAFFDAYINRVGSNARNYYNVEQVDNLLNELEEE